MRDVFDRMVDSEDIHSGFVHVNKVAALLRKYHLRVTKIVKRKPSTMNPTLAMTDFGKGYRMACSDILDLLKKVKSAKR